MSETLNSTLEIYFHIVGRIKQLEKEWSNAFHFKRSDRMLQVTQRKEELEDLLEKIAPCPEFKTK